ncbi:aldehyde dehydrogenase family protein [Luteolibacter sp. LG18]|uniref:L-piperidine-6-carboxylate dehydrogenase n=1 Tax=Luteolibacter sp. LG18 TaxID=2819286 RepID=UPI002B2D738D|nr:aldehyde dehydrogenase [Luteolibacter sp. LG18]
MLTFLHSLGIEGHHAGVFDGTWHGSGPEVASVSPIDGRVIARIQQATAGDCKEALARAQEAFQAWREVPAPVRGKTVRRIGNALRAAKEDLARLITLETGKILAEAEGEVQEMIDICDFATGLSRQLHGLTIASERPAHRLMEQWHPLGPIGVITAFNFPTAVWSWNAALAAVCGDAVLWKPSHRAPLCAIATTRLVERVCKGTGANPAIFTLLCGSGDIAGDAIVKDPRVPLVSATGSCTMGRRIAATVHARLGRTLLELGGNNAVIVTPTADLDLAVRAIFFGAIGTAGQRCTTTRRVIVHESIETALRERLLKAYSSLRIGNPLDRSTVMGPVIHPDAVAALMQAKRRIIDEGGEILHGGESLPLLGPCYVSPCLARSHPDMPVVREEVFAPLLHLLSYRDFEDAIACQNAVPQGLSSAIFTNDFREAERFLSARGSDCGIANVNAGTSGAEIGGAFGGEKDTGGGRESGSDAWKNYMRRQTSTLNHGTTLPLAQGIQFGDPS